jgi:hypothetical protein
MEPHSVHFALPRAVPNAVYGDRVVIDVRYSDALRRGWGDGVVSKVCGVLRADDLDQNRYLLEPRLNQ